MHIITSDSTASFLTIETQTATDTDAEQRGKAQRPSFSSSVTADRLRECERWPPLTAKSHLKASGSDSGSRGRGSVFKEIGLEDYEIANTTGLSALKSSTGSPANADGNVIKRCGEVRVEADKEVLHAAMGQHTALGYSAGPENRMRYDENLGPMLGAFGTEICGGVSGSNSAGRSSLGGNSGPSASGTSSMPSAVRNDGNSATAGKARVSGEPMEYQGVGGVMAGAGRELHEWGEMSDRASTNSSTDDLLAGHEPNFISVVLSPRRMLRVINRD